MYTLLLLILLGISAWFIISGIKNNRKSFIWFGSIFFVLTIFFFGFMSFWGDMLWFKEIGYQQRFWKEIYIKAIYIIIGAIVGGVVTFIFTYSVPRHQIPIRVVGILVAVIYGISWGYSNWDIILKYANKIPMGIQEPILNKDASFYLFSLPLLERIHEFLMFIFIVIMATVVIAAQNSATGKASTRTDHYKSNKSLIVSGFIFMLILAFGKYLARFDLLYSDWGVVNGPGRTDDIIRLPAYGVSIVITMILAIGFITPSIREKMASFISRFNIQSKDIIPYTLGGVLGVIFLSWLIILSIIPSLYQGLRVEPNEISLESPYIENNIKFTRYGFQLNDIEEKEYPVEDIFNDRVIDQNKTVFNNIRLWDWRALKEVYNQFQEIRLYYEFEDVDIDRYTINGKTQQVMVSAREMDITNLPQKSKTYVNKRFKYTHGYGITLTQVNEFTANGAPNLLIKDIPPKSEFAELTVTRPEIYYGELTNTPVIVNSEEKEFDYPSGEKNVYTRYKGTGGVQIKNFWRKFLFGWKYDGTKFLLSGYPTSESRIMFNRQIEQRVKKLAPFLKFDKDPYIVLADGKLHWIIDAYTVSNKFPYSEPFVSSEDIEYKEGASQRGVSSNVAPRLNGVNYLRNSVKITVDAYNGTVNFYIYENDDPIIQVWNNIFPGFFKDKKEMPDVLKDHVRYPIDKLLVQGQVYAKYHMTDPEVFYNQEDLWVRATEKYYNQIQPVDPYYIIWELPDSNKSIFTLMQPYTPKNRQVMIGWIAGLGDPDNYGKFIAFKFPKEKRILGPQQVETKIDQDPHLSGQLTLWDQRGSNVIRGNVLAIPVGKTIIYVEPIYLQSETAAYPELRLVAIMHGDKLSYAPTFDEALNLLLERSPGDKVLSPIEKQEKPREDVDNIIKNANNAFNDYIKYMGNQEFNKASNALNNLKQSLQQLEEEYK